MNIVTASNVEGLCLNELSEQLQKLQLKGSIEAILHTINDTVSDTVKSDSTKLIYGRHYIREELLGKQFKITPFSFFQTNSKGAEYLYKLVLDFIDDTNDKIIFDLYSGTGTIAQLVSEKAKMVYAIEIVKEAVDAAKQNAVTNGIENVEFIEGDVLKAVDLLTEKPDLIVIDPPREGIHPKAIKKIIEMKAESIIYVSCNAVTLVNNLQHFIDAGYSVDRVEAVDMYMRTAHCEVVCRLSI